MDFYEIIVKGHVGKRWLNSHGGMKLEHRSTGETVISGPVQDQSALHGILNRIRDMNLTLVNVMKKDADSADSVR